MAFLIITAYIEAPEEEVTELQDAISAGYPMQISVCGTAAMPVITSTISSD